MRVDTIGGMEILIAVVVVAALAVIGLIAYSGYSNAKLQRDREQREASKYGTVSAATLAARESAPAPRAASEHQPGAAGYETKSVTFRMRERVGAVNMRPSADAAKLEKLLAEGWEIVTQTQAPHGARMTTFVLRRPV